MRTLRKIWSLIGTLTVILMVLLAILLVGVRLIGLTPYTVLSGSMEPAYHVGSLIYVKEIQPQDITIGTPITFVVNKDLVVATHRVVDIRVLTTKEEPQTDESGQPITDDKGNPIMQTVPLAEPTYYYQTKGDANDAVDASPVHYKNVIGTPVFSIPLLGYLSSWLQTRSGMIMGASIALVLLILTFLPDLLKLTDEKPAKDAPPPDPVPAEPIVTSAAPVVRRRRSAKYEQKEPDHHDEE